jgi:hypothetical protein
VTVGDLAAVRQLCEWQLAARRLGCRILVPDASDSLRELIVLAGLAPRPARRVVAGGIDRISNRQGRHRRGHVTTPRTADTSPPARLSRAR